MEVGVESVDHAEKPDRVVVRVGDNRKLVASLSQQATVISIGVWIDQDYRGIELRWDPQSSVAILVNPTGAIRLCVSDDIV